MRPSSLSVRPGPKRRVARIAAGIGAAGFALAVLAAAPALAVAQTAYGCTTYGYDGGWGSAPPASAPYPACNSILSFGTSVACTGAPCPATGAWGYPQYRGY